MVHLERDKDRSEQRSRIVSEVVAEGIETAGQRRFLAERHGCDYQQGYLLSRPLPADEAGQYLNLNLNPIGIAA
jgi:EAL domain-containing protein (putative c-di-GMP-specific phosphodiesterase class I)